MFVQEIYSEPAGKKCDQNKTVIKHLDSVGSL